MLRRIMAVERSLDLVNLMVGSSNLLSVKLKLSVEMLCMQGGSSEDNVLCCSLPG